MQTGAREPAPYTTMRRLARWLPLLTLAAVAVVPPASCPAAAPDGLVGWWSFDGDRGAVARDRSGHGNHGTIRGAVRVPGRVGQALQFASERACVRVPCRPSLNLGSALTVEAWVRPVAPTDISRVILSKNDEYALRIDKMSEGGKVSFFPHVGSPAVAWEPRVSSCGPLSPGEWHHVAAVWDGRRERLYVDGELQGEVERPGQPNPNPYPLMIGNWEYPSCHGTAFGGSLDEVKVWRRALSAEEVLAHARLGG